MLLYAQYRTCESVASKSIVRVRLSVCLCCKYVLHTGAMYSIVRVCSFVCLCCLYCFIVCFVFYDTLFIYCCKLNIKHHLSLRSVAPRIHTLRPLLLPTRLKKHKSLNEPGFNLHCFMLSFYDGKCYSGCFIQ